MVSVKPLDRLTLADLWREVREEDAFWSDTAERQRTLLKHLLERTLDEEMVLLLEAARYRRVESRPGYRNGFYERHLATQMGIIKGVRVPRGRPGGQEGEVFARYQRRQAQVNALIREIFLAGISTRRVGEVLEPLLGERLSAQTVSRVAQRLHWEVERFHRALLPDDVLYLLLDGVSMRVKGALGVKRRLVLCAYAITVQGQRQLLDFRMGRPGRGQRFGSGSV